MNAGSYLLVLTAFSTGVIHTLLGPDHYIPFVAISRVNKWSSYQTLRFTGLCGLLHVASSLVVGGVGWWIGSMLSQLETLDGVRSDVASWLLIVFGSGYLMWGLVKTMRCIHHQHPHPRASNPFERRGRRPATQPEHPGAALTVELKDRMGSLTPWGLFLIIAFGPCEVLIPLMMVPAVASSVWVMTAVVLAFSLATVCTMLGCVIATLSGLSFIELPNWNLSGHAFAGLAIVLCGALVKFGF